MKRSTALIFFFGALVMIAVVLWTGYTRAWKDFGTEPGFRYIKTYSLPFDKFTTEKRIYSLAKQHPTLYSLDSGTRFSSDNWFTLTLNKSTDSVVCIFRFAGDTALWKQTADSEILLLSLEDRDRDIHYSSEKNNSITDTGNLYRLFEHMVLDSLRTKKNDRAKSR